MGKHYANMRVSRHDSEREETRITEEKTHSDHLSEIKKDSTCPYPAPSNFRENKARFSEKKDPILKSKREMEIGQLTLSADASLNDKMEESTKHIRSPKKTPGYSKAFQNAALFLIFILPLILTLLVFLVSWIFVPWLIALRIALWTLVGIVVFELVLLFLDSMKG